MAKLEEILQAEVGAEIDDILAAAASRAAEIVSEAQTRAADRLAAHRQQLAASARAADQQARSAADLTVSRARMEARGEVLDLLRQKVDQALAEMPSKPDYPAILQALAAEALGVAAAAATLVVHPEDQDSMRDWAREQGLELETDEALRLGVRIVGRHGTTVENTVPERLRRAWGELGPQVTKILWE
jgi:V/A-type H+/Na+-transporting ATPase subunit E